MARQRAPKIPDETTIAAMDAQQAAAANVRLEAMQGGVAELRPEQAADITRARGRLRERMDELGRFQREEEAKRMTKEFKEWEDKVKGLERKIRGLKEEGVELEKAREINTSEEARLDADAAGIAESMSKLEAEGQQLTAAEGELAQRTQELETRQSTGIKSINEIEVADLAEAKRKYHEAVALIKGGAKAKRAALRAEIGTAHGTLLTEAARLESDKGALSRKVGIALDGQTEAGSANQAFLARKAITEKQYTDNQAALAQAEAELGGLEKQRPPEPPVAPPTPALQINPDATEAPLAETIDEERIRDDAAAATIEIDLILAPIMLEEHRKGKVLVVRDSLNSTRSLMRKVAASPNDDEKTRKLDGIKHVMEEGNGKSLSEMEVALAKASAALQRLNPKVVTQREIERYTSEVKWAQGLVRAERAFYDRLMAWLNSDRQGPVPARRRRAAAPAAVSEPAPTTGLSPEMQALADDLMDRVEEIVACGDRSVAVAPRSAPEAVEASTNPGAIAPAGPSMPEGAPQDAIPTQHRLPVLTAGEVQKIKTDLQSDDPTVQEDALSKLFNREPSPEWDEILTTASQHPNATVRSQTPMLCRRIITPAIRSQYWDLYLSGLRLFRKFSEDQDRYVVQRSVSILLDSVGEASKLGADDIGRIVTFYLTEEHQAFTLDRLRDWAVQEIDNMRILAKKEGVEKVQAFLYNFFATVLAQRNRRSYPGAAIDNILHILERNPDCLAPTEVCHLPLSNHEFMDILAVRAEALIESISRQGDAPRQVQQDRARLLCLEAEDFLILKDMTPEEETRKVRLLEAIQALDSYMKGETPLELDSISSFLEGVKKLDESYLEGSLRELLEEDRFFPEVDRDLEGIGIKVASDKPVSEPEKITIQRTADWLAHVGERLKGISAKKDQIKNKEVSTLLDRVMGKWDELNATVEDLQAVLFSVPLI